MKSINFNTGIKTYAINGDESNTVKINVNDVNIAARLKECQKQIDEISDEIQVLKSPTPEQIAEYDAKIKKLIDYSFGADISSHAFGNMNCLSPLSDGTLLLFSFMDAFVPAVLEDIQKTGNRVQTRNRAKIESYTADLDAPQVAVKPGTESIDLSVLNEKQIAFLKSLQ